MIANNVRHKDWFTVDTYLVIVCINPVTSLNKLNMLSVKVKSMQRPGTEAIRIQIQPSKPKRMINKITHSQNTKRTYGQPSEQLFPKRWPISNPNRTKNNMNTRKVKRHRNSDTKNRQQSNSYLAETLF